MLVDWQLVAWNVGNRLQILVQEAIVFREDVTFLVVWQVHIVNNCLPLALFIFSNVELGSYVSVNFLQHLQRVLQRPLAKQVRVPVVVDVVVVFVRTGYGMQHVLVLTL